MDSRISLLMALIGVLVLPALVACGDNEPRSRTELERAYEDAVEDMDRRLEDLQDELAQASGAARAELEERLGDLEALREETAERWDDLGRLDDDAFEARRDEFEDGLEDLRDRLRRLFD